MSGRWSVVGGQWLTCASRTAGALALAVIAAVAAPAVAVDPAVLEAEQTRVETIERVRPSVLAVFGPTAQGGGSGVVISPDGFALTNFHVVSGTGHHLKCGMADGRLYDAVLVGLDPTGDIALIKLFGRDDFPCAELGDSDTLRVGDAALVMGNPFLLAADYQPTVTYGIISGVHRYQYPSGTVLEYADCIQTDASINPGNSGGPLFDGDGRLIGINGRGSFEKRGRVNVGVGYAISINQIKNFLGSLKGGLIVDHATLGATVSTDPEGRVIVTDILEESDAYRRGLRYGDEIIAFGGRTISTVNAFKNALGIFPRGWRVPLSYRREGERHDVDVRLRGVHSAGELADLAGQKNAGPMPRPKPGDKPPENPPDDDDDEAPKDRPPRIRRPAPGKAREAPLPDVIREHYEQRRGYANAYFNREAVERVWRDFVAKGAFDTARGAWTLSGQFDGGGEFRVVLDDDGVKLTVPAGEARIEETDDLSTSLDPPNSGGLLVALHLWRRLLTRGPQEFGELHYFGDGPVPGVVESADLLEATHANVEAMFAFDPADGRLVTVEMYPALDADPCELLFSDYAEVDGRLLPGKIEVRYGDTVYATLLVEDSELKAKEGP